MHTPRRDTCRSTTPHTRAPTAGPDAPLCCHSTPPHPAAATCARPARQASEGPITGCCWGAAPARRSRRLHGPQAAPPTSPPPAGARLGCGRLYQPPAPPARAPPGLRGPGQSGSTHFPGPALAARGRCRARAPLFVNKPAGPLRHLRSRTLNASGPATPTQGRSWDGGWGEREARGGDAARSHCSPSALLPPPPGSPPGLASRGPRGLGVRTLTPGA